MCDIIYSGYDVINIVGAMTYKQWYDVIKSGCDVINSAYGVVHAVGVFHTYIWCHINNQVGVITHILCIISHSLYV